MKYAIMSKGSIVDMFNTKAAAEYFIQLQKDSGLNWERFEIVELVE